MESIVPFERRLWQFAVQAWRAAGVERTCLALQDRFSIPAASLLLASWLGNARYPPDAALARQARALVEEWEAQRLSGLRGLRREAAKRPEWAEWKRLLQDAELEGERLVFTELDVLVDAHPRALEASPTVRAWLLLMVPDSASCEEIGRLIEELVEALPKD